MTEIIDRFERGQGYVIEALTTINAGKQFHWWKLPVDEAPDFIAVLMTTLYGMIAYLAHREGTTVEDQIQQFAITMRAKIEEEKSHGS